MQAIDNVYFVFKYVRFLRFQEMSENLDFFHK
jgi:hypothetical protein